MIKGCSYTAGLLALAENVWGAQLINKSYDSSKVCHIEIKFNTLSNLKGDLSTVYIRGHPSNTS